MSDNKAVTFDTIILEHSNTRQLLEANDILDAVEEAFIEFTKGE